MKKIFILSAVILSQFVFCFRDKEPIIPEEDQKIIMTVQEETLASMKSGMMKVLLEKVASDGYAKSVKYCSEFAPQGGKKLNEQLSEKFKSELNLKNFKFKRTSLKYRNPKNAPDELENSVLTSWVDVYNQGKEIKPHVEPTQNGYRILVPMLVMTSTCLGCHGMPEAMDKQAEAVINELYPEDKAKGFVVGDLRGAVSIEIEK